MQTYKLMKATSASSYVLKIISGVFLCCSLSACLKPSDSEIQPSFSKEFTNGDVLKALESQADLSLFRLAFNRLGIGTGFKKNEGYTLFAPTDSAMKAFGLNEGVIKSLALDSLRKLMNYHVTAGTFDEVSFSTSFISQKIETFRKDTTFNQQTGFKVTAPPLYVKSNGQIYFNGFPSGKSNTSISSSNGTIYPIKHVLQPISNSTLLDVISTEADLSLYWESIKLADSIRVAVFGDFDANKDELLLASIGTVAPCILAPTNAAFNKAGFHNLEDIRQYALSTTPYAVMDPATYMFTMYLSPLDSVLNQHFISNYSTTAIFYNDLMNPKINGVFSTNRKFMVEWTDVTCRPAFQPRFSAVSGQAQVQWSDKSTIPASIPLDADAHHPVRNFTVSNGTLYKVDQLFYPHP